MALLTGFINNFSFHGSTSFLIISDFICYRISILFPLFLSYINMNSLDIKTSLSPVINLTDAPTDLSIIQARTARKIKITIDHIDPLVKMVIPIRIVEGMGEIMERGTVTQKQAGLISKLYDLMMSSPALRA